MESEKTKTFYTILEVSPNATTEEIKKSYKKLALKFHPDKNLDDVETAKEKFSEIQEAYKILSDPEQRAWYEKNKHLFHDTNIPTSEYYLNQKYFTSRCYKGFNDDKNGFYTVYRELFDEIIKQETPYYNDSLEFEYPTFGNLDTDLESVKYFYDMWQSFSTKVSFDQLNKYDIRFAPNNKILRLMERENKKIRENARKQRNEEIRKLVNLLRNKDKRMDNYRALIEMKNKENRKKSELVRRKKILENVNNAKNYVEAEWTSLKSMEKELQEIEAECELQEREKNKRKVKNPNDLIKNKQIDNDNNSDNFSMQDDENTTNDDDYTEDNMDSSYINYCIICSKSFKSINAFKNHEKSKKHLNNNLLYQSLK